jgi:hypothetical protein
MAPSKCLFHWPSAARQRMAAAGTLRQLLEGRDTFRIEQMHERSMMVENAASLIEV